MRPAEYFYTVEYNRALRTKPVLSLAAPPLTHSCSVCVRQGACLGQQDAWTPLRIFVLAGLFNLVADMFLILHLGLGIAGAAVATAAAQYLGAFIFLVRFVFAVLRCV
jgi:Na+-driven multidrug efflux pump